MAEIKVTQMPSATVTSPDDYFMVIQGGANKKMTLKTLLANMFSSQDIIFGGGNGPSSPVANHIVFKNQEGTNPLLYMDTTGSGRISVNGYPPLSNQAALYINGTVNIGSLYLDSFEILATTTGVVSLSKETTFFKSTGTGTNNYTLSKGTVGQTKNLSFAGPSTGATPQIISIVIEDTPKQKYTDGSNTVYPTGFNKIELRSFGDGCVLKYMEDGAYDGAGTWIPVDNTGRWVCISKSGSVNLLQV